MRSGFVYDHRSCDLQKIARFVYHKRIGSVRLNGDHKIDRHFKSKGALSAPAGLIILAISRHFLQLHTDDHSLYGDCEMTRWIAHHRRSQPRHFDRLDSKCDLSIESSDPHYTPTLENIPIDCWINLIQLHWTGQGENQSMGDLSKNKWIDDLEKLSPRETPN